MKAVLSNVIHLSETAARLYEAPSLLGEDNEWFSQLVETQQRKDRVHHART